MMDGLTIGGKMMRACGICGQDVEDQDLYWHASVRHTITAQRAGEEDETKTYYAKYPRHRFHRGEWEEYLADKYPVLSESLVKMSDAEREKICDLIARDEAARIREEAKLKVEEHMIELGIRVPVSKLPKRRWWRPWLL